MLTHPSRTQNPEGEAAEGGAALAQGRKPKWVTGHLYQDTPNPTLNLHCRRRSANRSQRGVEPQKGSQLHDTAENRRCPRKIAEQSHQKRLSKSLPHPQQEERIQSSAATEKNPTHINRDHQQGTTSRSRPTHPHM